MKRNISTLTKWAITMILQKKWITVTYLPRLYRRPHHFQA